MGGCGRSTAVVVQRCLVGYWMVPQDMGNNHLQRGGGGGGGNDC